MQVDAEISLGLFLRRIRNTVPSYPLLVDSPARIVSPTPPGSAKNGEYCQNNGVRKRGQDYVSFAVGIWFESWYRGTKAWCVLSTSRYSRARKSISSTHHCQTPPTISNELNGRREYKQPVSPTCNKTRCSHHGDSTMCSTPLQKRTTNDYVTSFST